MSSMTMLMFKPGCFDPEATPTFQNLLREVTQIGHGNSEGWVMEFGAKLRLTHNVAEKLYAEHSKKPFYDSLVDFASSGESFVSVWSCKDAEASEVGRKVVTQIRQDYDKSDPEATGPDNIIHGSDSLESSSREVRWALRCMILQCAGFCEEG